MLYIPYLVKACSVCRSEFPVTTAFFYRQKRGLYGFTAECKTCHHARIKRNKESDPDKYRERGRLSSQKWRILHPEQYRESSHRYNKRSRQLYPEKHRQANKQWRLNNPEKALANSKKWAKSHPEEAAECARKSSKKWRENNREQSRKIALAYSKRNPDKSRQNTRTRSSRKRALPTTFSLRDWDRCLVYWKNTCSYCGRPRGLWHTLAQDHWIPLSKGGGYTAGNILPACHGIDGCNNYKRNYDPHEWLIDHFGPRKAKQIEKRIAEYFAWVKSHE